MEAIFPRSVREVMCGWVHLPRFIDKVRLHLAGKLHPDYQANFGKGFDGLWLEAAGVKLEDFIEVVRNSITDGQVADWVRQNVKASEQEKARLNNYILNRGSDNAESAARLEQRKKDCNLAHRTDVKTFVDFIDADEKRI